MTDNTRTTEDTVKLRSFRRIALITICAVYFLILVGATVRASGAGMGCPDWPTCFGSWIPPVSEAQLPDNYQEIYADRGYAETRFNPVKTWIEYLNRLTGVVIGLLILVTAWKSLALRSHDRWITIASVAALLMVIYQGWLGSRVVASNLQPGMITLHMLMALAIVAILLFAFARARRGVLAAQPAVAISRHFQRWFYVVIALTVLQVAMGTQVREMVDFLNHTQGEERSAWVSALPWFFYVHRTFSAVVLLANAWLVWTFYRSFGLHHSLTRLALGVLAVIVLAIISGATLGHLGMPAIVQPTHLLAASLIFGLQFLLWMDYRHARGV
ncbi:cytochrome oxidase assembly protein [Pseudohongiella acticola]|uniref:Cytochrome oxidase assembly protein n=1 Tax=Pseudohongiella acticola TaxID=1524254 RepID=A0A1E8CJ84_9GAMM|nr:COX15/CtaA family protein [Pseudohongiella acticola]OFE12355.1 cytochrome oxidase assembly protein [Pseudohongiella acticola]